MIQFRIGREKEGTNKIERKIEKEDVKVREDERESKKKIIEK